MAAMGLGITDVIKFQILAGSWVVLGAGCGFVAALMASLTWFLIVAPKAAPGRQTEVVRRICRAAQRLGIVGFILLVIGSGNGSSL